jgi:hypothetical protein
MGILNAFRSSHLRKDVPSVHIKLQNDLVVVQPPLSEQSDEDEPGLGALVSGRIIIVTLPWIHIAELRLAVVSTATFFGRKFESATIYEAYQDFGKEAIETRLHDDERFLQHGVEFDIQLPAWFPSHELTNHHEIVSRVWTCVRTAANTASSETQAEHTGVIDFGESQLRLTQQGEIQDHKSTSMLDTARWTGSDAKTRSSRRCFVIRCYDR